MTLSRMLVCPRLFWPQPAVVRFPASVGQSPRKHSSRGRVTSPPSMSWFMDLSSISVIGLCTCACLLARCRALFTHAFLQSMVPWHLRLTCCCSSTAAPPWPWRPGNYAWMATAGLQRTTGQAEDERQQWQERWPHHIRPGAIGRHSIPKRHPGDARWSESAETKAGSRGPQAHSGEWSFSGMP